jgi:hypothetical protein
MAHRNLKTLFDVLGIIFLNLPLVPILRVFSPSVSDCQCQSCECAENCCANKAAKTQQAEAKSCCSTKSKTADDRESKLVSCSCSPKQLLKLTRQSITLLEIDQSQLLFQSSQHFLVALIIVSPREYAQAPTPPPPMSIIV